MSFELFFISWSARILPFITEESLWR
jgi:hypothetical protein